MIDQLRPYSKTKQTGLPWLGDVPAHWDVRRNGRLFGARRETGFPDLPVLEVSIRSGVRIRDFDNGGRKQEMTDRSKYQRAVRGDIAYNMMRMWQGAVGIAPADGLVSPAYVVARPFPETDAAYYAYLFRTAAYMREIDVFSRGIVPDRNRLYWESFKQMPSVYPPLDEQRLIVRFLDWHGAQTLRLVRAKKKIIALLNEQKQAIIHRAVTRGLDPNAKLKPSGIPWLGDVPEGWEVKRLRRLATKFGSGVTPKGGATGYMADGVIFLRSQNIHFDGLRLQDVARIPRATHEAMKGTHVRACDVLLNITGASIGRACAVPVAFADDANVNQHVCIIRAKRDEVVPEFLAAVISTPVMQREIRFEQNGASREGLTLDAIKSFAIPLPPRSEQRLILESIKLEALQWDAATFRFEREIALIQEFRTRLIADVVTGKLDVRAAAAGLPEATEIEPIDDLIESDDLDEAIDETENEEVAA
jgi:type I restriction enzyme S subunit